MAHDSRPGIGRQHALEALGRIVGAVGDDDHARMDRIADADAAAVMDAHPRRPGSSVEEGVEDGPVGDRVGAVTHRLGLAIRRRNGAGVEVVSPDDDRRPHAPRPDELVDRKPGAGPIAVAEPADPRRKPLERHPPRRQLEPPLEHRVVRERVAHRVVDRGDVRLVSGQGRPPKRPDPTAEQRPDIGRDEARVCERVVYAGFTGLTSEVVAIIENIAALPDVLEQAADVLRDRGARPPHVLVRIRRPERGRLRHVEPLRHVAGERVVRGRLVGDEIEVLAAARQLGHDVGRVAE